VTVTDVRLDRIESVDAYFVAGVLLTNPNAREIAVEALDGTLAVEGETVATAALSAPVRVPAGGRRRPRSSQKPASTRSCARWPTRCGGSARRRRAGLPSCTTCSKAS
jgi:hypothetical protein